MRAVPQPPTQEPCNIPQKQNAATSDCVVRRVALAWGWLFSHPSSRLLAFTAGIVVCGVWLGPYAVPLCLLATCLLMCASCSRPANRFELVACHLCATPEQNVFSTVIHDVLTRTARFRAQFMLGVQGDAHINNSSVHLQWAQPALASQPIPSTPHPAATPLSVSSSSLSISSSLPVPPHSLTLCISLSSASFLIKRARLAAQSFCCGGRPRSSGRRRGGGGGSAGGR